MVKGLIFFDGSTYVGDDLEIDTTVTGYDRWTGRLRDDVYLGC